jgi:hypothetical protein
MANVVGESSNPIIAAVQGSQTWAGGDFTPSASPEHVMRAMDRVRARAVIIGISHARMLSRRGRIPALVARR